MNKLCNWEIPWPWHYIFMEKLDIIVIVYLDNIFIYTIDDRNSHIVAIWWVLE